MAYFKKSCLSCQITGRLGNAPRLYKDEAGNDKCARLSVAVTTVGKDSKESVSWFTIWVNGAQVPALAKLNLGKGDLVCADCHMATREVELADGKKTSAISLYANGTTVLYRAQRSQPVQTSQPRQEANPDDLI